MVWPIARRVNIVNTTPMERLFEDLFEDFEKRLLTPTVGKRNDLTKLTTPNIDMTETEDEVAITADLPGMEEKDVEITIENDTLTLRGSRKEEHEEKEKNYYLSERTYGEFQRMIPLPASIDTEKAKAVFKNGVLKVSLPKLPEAKTHKKKIEVTKES